MLLELVTDIDSPSGYSAFARAFGEALHGAGVELKVTPHKHDRTTIPQNEFWSKNMLEFATDKRKPDVRMHIETPEFFQPVQGVKNIGFTFWETDRIPGGWKEGEPGIPANFNWVNQMNMMDEIWTGASSAALAFRESGVTVPIRVVGTPMQFSDEDGELPITGITVDGSGNPVARKDRRIVIGSCAQFNFRKNLEDLIIGVCSEFRSDEVVLLLKTYGSQQNDPQQEQGVRNRVIGLKNAIGWKDIPQVVLVQNTLTDQDMRKFYNSMDIFVTATRGEGFCIPAAQAMAAGVPTVCTGWSAMMDFVIGEAGGYGVGATDGPQTGWPINYQMEPVFGMPFIPWYRPDQRWARINMVHMMETLRTIYDGIKNDNPEIRRIAQRGAETVRREYSPEAIGKLGREYLEACLAS